MFVPSGISQMALNASNVGSIPNATRYKHMKQEIIIEPNTEREERIIVDAEQIIDNGDGTLTIRTPVILEDYKGIIGSKGTV